MKSKPNILTAVIRSMAREHRRINRAERKGNWALEVRADARLDRLAKWADEEVRAGVAS